MKTVQSMLVPWRKALRILMEQSVHCIGAITERASQILSREHVRESVRKSCISWKPFSCRQAFIEGTPLMTLGVITQRTDMHR